MREAAESDRLLYVAMTRAEEHLVLSCSGDAELSGWAACLESSWRLNLSAPWDGPREEHIDSVSVRVICTDRPPAPASRPQPPWRTPRNDSGPPAALPPVLCHSPLKRA